MCVCFDVTLYKTRSSYFLVKYVVKSSYIKRKTYADSPKLKAKKKMRENGWLLLNGYRVSVWGDSKVLETDNHDGHTTLGM